MSKIFTPVIDQIESIEELPLEECEMFDIGMVDNPHTFFANSILVHNSVFFESLPLINYRYPSNNFTDAELVTETRSIAQDVEKFINKSYTVYAKLYHCVDRHTWKIKQEMIGRRAFWGSAKKRYAMHIVNKNGVPVDEIEIKGFDTVRSSYPRAFRTEMRAMIERILQDVPVNELNRSILEFKRKFNQTDDLISILTPSSVKEYTKYIGKTKGTPIHIKSAQNCNALFALNKINDIPYITDGDKILYGYVKQNPYGFETMAIRGIGDETPQVVLDFMNRYIDRERIFESYTDKIETIFNDLKFGKIDLTDYSKPQYF